MIDSNWFANNRGVAETFQRERKAILAIYEQAERDNIEETCRKLQALSLEVYDQEEEVELWREIAARWKQMTEQQKKTRLEQQSELNRAKEKKNNLERQMERQEKHSDQMERHSDDRQDKVFATAFLGL